MSDDNLWIQRVSYLVLYTHQTHKIVELTCLLFSAALGHSICKNQAD